MDTTMALLTHTTITQKDPGIMNMATTGMAATLHHIKAATHTTDMGLHSTFEWCLGHSHLCQMQLATLKKEQKSKAKAEQQNLVASML
ncbi:hypothetical protein WJX77_002448 [Trebouxia sp. C0004]